MTGALIMAEGLTMRYANGTLALEGASFKVRAGELLVILGQNGCGKSTLLRCVAGLQKPTGGLVSVAGQTMTDLTGRYLARARMELGMVFQQARLVGRRSVLANVLCGTLGRNQTLTTALGMFSSGDAPLAMECLDAVGLAGFAAQRASTLSGGQAQRVSIARALAQKPMALLADEPVASLDPDAAIEVMQLLRRISEKDGLAVVCVLHQPALARRFGDRVLGMKRGQVMFDMPPAALSDGQIGALYSGEGAWSTT